MVKPNTVCANCGKPIYRTPKRIAAGETVTCSIDCKAALMRRPKEPNAICGYCGTPFYRIPSSLKKSKRNFCSQECYLATVRVDRSPNTTCEKCGKSFYRSEYDKGRAEHHFCSYSCSAGSRKRSIDGHCAVCGKPVTRTAAQARKSRHGKMFCSREHSVAWQLELEGPNGLEVDFLARFPQLRFVGNGQLWVTADGDSWMNPDFILPDTNKVVELWGNFWHRDDDPQERIDRLADAGYEAIVVWENDFREHPDVTSQLVKDFLSG